MSGSAGSRFAQERGAKAICHQKIWIEGAGDVEQRPKQIEMRIVPGALVAIVLHRAGPIDVRHQRSVFEAHGFDQLARAQHEFVVFLVQGGALEIDALLQLPDADETQGQNDEEQPIFPILSSHFRFRREKTAMAMSSTMAQ